MRKLFQFSVRDMFLLVLILAIGLGWWLDHRAMDDKRIAATAQAERFRGVLWKAKYYHDALMSGVESDGYRETGMLTILKTQAPNWSVLDEPIIEP